MKSVEEKIRKYLTERGWDNLRPADLAKSISIEAAELLELFQWDNPSLEEVKQNSERLEKIKSELADVLIYALDMSVLLGLDTKKVILSKLDAIQKKYPADIIRNSANKELGSEDVYLKIKQNYRRKGLR
ncbi:MAG: MazG-like family protein [Candidatus Roizmanbacteria bacterium]